MTVDAHHSGAGDTSEVEASAGSAILKPVFIPAAVVIVCLIALVLLFREQTQDLTAVLNKVITDGVGCGMSSQ